MYVYRNYHRNRDKSHPNNYNLYTVHTTSACIKYYRGDEKKKCFHLLL